MTEFSPEIVTEGSWSCFMFQLFPTGRRYERERGQTSPGQDNPHPPPPPCPTCPPSPRPPPPIWPWEPGSWQQFEDICVVCCEV